MAIRLLLFSVVLSFFCFSVQAQSEKKVLFVGNSYTYFWNLPQNVAAMSNDKPSIRLKTKQSTAGGANLGQHWRGEKELKTKEILSNEKFDFVVLQDHSMRSIEHPDSLSFFGKKFATLIKEMGAQPVVYMTWAREWNPFMQETITKEYLKLAESINAKVVPVGLAWKMAKELRPDIKLYDQDGSHPSALGTYLTACVFYGVLTGESPVGLTHRLISKDMHQEKLYLNIQSKEDALFCQLIALETLKSFPD